MAINSSKIPDDTEITAFKSSIRGELVRPGDAGYDVARKIFNAMIDRHPAFIVRCAGIADVIAAVRFARSHDLLVAIRGAGHNIAGTSMCDGGLVIDLSRMKSVRIDPVAGTARVEGGVTWGELNHDLQAFGLAATGGFIGTTGVSGLTLGGGLGWLVRKHGLALDNLLSADVVTAEGELLVASPSQNEDLFWGVRGGGGNFGVVTSFEFRVHPAGTVLAGLVLHPLSAGKEALRFWRDFGPTAPEALLTARLCSTRRPKCQCQIRYAENPSWGSAAFIPAPSTRRRRPWRRSGPLVRPPLTRSSRCPTAPRRPWLISCGRPVH
jgi:UDP-N-acetylenolpyruvoylglucosamine reductase